MTGSPHCSTTAEDILAFVDGEASPDVVHHVQSCQACLTEARAQGNLQRALHRMLYRFDCPSSQTIGDYQLDMLAAGERTDVARHLLECRECTGELGSLRAFLARDPPLPSSIVGRVKRMVAGLIVPAQGRPQPAARGAGGGTGTRLYQAGELTIMFERQPVPLPNGTSVVGMVLQTGVDVPTILGAEVRLTTRDGVTHRQTLDDLGSFAFDNVSAGIGRFELELPDQVIVVEQLPVGEESS